MSEPIWRIHLYDTKSRLRVLEGWLTSLGLAPAYRDGIAHPSSMRKWLTGLSCLELEIPRTHVRRLARSLPIDRGDLDLAVVTDPVPTIIVRCQTSQFASRPWHQVSSPEC